MVYMAHEAPALVICSRASWLEWNSDHGERVSLVSGPTNITVFRIKQGKKKRKKRRKKKTTVTSLENN